MKTLKLLPLVFLLSTFAACKKATPIPSDKEYYIGLWKPEKPNAGETIELQINADGTGRYATSKKGKQVTYEGNVYFQGGDDFAIGGKLIKKKIEVSRPPAKIIESLTPLVFHFEATFDDVRFRR